MPTIFKLSLKMPILCLLPSLRLPQQICIGFAIQQTRTRNLNLLLTSCVTRGKLLHPAEPHFLFPQNGSACFRTVAGFECDGAEHHPSFPSLSPCAWHHLDMWLFQAQPWLTCLCQEIHTCSTHLPRSLEHSHWHKCEHS